MYSPSLLYGADGRYSMSNTIKPPFSEVAIKFNQLSYYSNFKQSMVSYSFFFSKPTKHFLSHSIWCIFSLVHYCLVCKKWLVFWCRYTRDYDPDRHLKSQPGFFIIILVFSPKPNPNPQDFFSKTTSFISTFKSSLVVSNNTFLLLLLHKDTTSTAIPTTTTLPKCRH